MDDTFLRNLEQFYEVQAKAFWGLSPTWGVHVITHLAECLISASDPAVAPITIRAVPERGGLVTDRSVFSLLALHFS